MMHFPKIEQEMQMDGNSFSVSLYGSQMSHGLSLLVVRKSEFLGPITDDNMNAEEEVRRSQCQCPKIRQTHLVEPQSLNLSTPRKGLQEAVQRLAGITESRQVL